MSMREHLVVVFGVMEGKQGVMTYKDEYGMDCREI